MTEPVEFFKVKLSENLLESMMLAAVEAYVLGDPSSKKNREKIETLGYIWGVKKIEGGACDLFLDKTSISVSARRSKNSVTPHQHAARLKDNLMSRWSSHLSLLGDFHTHPYDDLTAVRAVEGWEFSPADIDFLQADDFLWERSGNTPVNLVMTVCKLGRIPESNGANCLRSSLWQFDSGEFRFWLNVNVGFLENGERCQTLDQPDRVFLDLDARFYNFAGYRMADHVRRASS